MKIAVHGRQRQRTHAERRVLGVPVYKSVCVCVCVFSFGASVSRTWGLVRKEDQSASSYMHNLQERVESSRVCASLLCFAPPLLHKCLKARAAMVRDNRGI